MGYGCSMRLTTMRGRPVRGASLAVVLGLLAGCGDSAPPAATDAGTDTGAQDTGATVDAPGDAAVKDAGAAEAGVDAGTDAGVDAGTDAGGGDATPDTGVDAGPGMDAGMDAGVDAGPEMDVTPDAGRECTPGDDTCGLGRYCTDGGACAMGCRDDMACAALAADAGGTALRCNPTSRQCVQCVSDGQCGGLQVCRDGVCTAGCSPERPCAAGLTCCNGTCADTTLSTAHCGACGTTCTSTNGTPFCDSGRCSVRDCPAGTASCDRDGSNGCETNTATSLLHCGGCGVFCSARPGAMAACGGGVCRYTCNAGRLNCDSDDSNGCETDADSNATHCGRCGNVCGAGSTCRQGACEPGGLVSLYPLDGNGMEAVDALADAMRQGLVMPTADRFAREPGAVRLDGSSAFLRAMPNPSLPVGAAARTVTVWARTTATYTSGAAGTVWDYGSNATRQRFGVQVQPGVATVVLEGETLTGTRAVNDGRWHFLAVTYDGTTLRLYVDAMDQGSRAVTLSTGAQELNIGRALSVRTPPEFFNGDLDELRVYSQALTAQQIQGLYTAGGFTP